jgi:hypothetical protein
VAEDVLRVKLTADGISEVMNALKKVQNQTEKTGAAGRTAADALGSLGVIFAAGKIASFAKGALDAADGLYKMSQKTGVAVEQLSVLTYMGQQADLSNGDLEKGMIKLAKSLVSLQAGEATATAAFSRLGLSASDLKDLSLDQALLKVANAQAKFADGAGKADVALALMGKSGANMIPFLNDMANGGVENAKKKLEALGLVLTGDMARASQDFNDSMKRMELAAQGATIQIAQGMLPGLTKSIDVLSDALAQTPAGMKAFAGGFLVIGAASTAAAVAIRAVGAALVGLGPIGIAVVALSAMTAGVIGLVAEMERAHQQDLKDIATKGRMITDGNKLVEQWSQENQELRNSGTNKEAAAKHTKAIKDLQEKLIAISPEYQKILGDETKGINEKAGAMSRLNGTTKTDLANRKATLEQSISELDQKIAAQQKFIDKPGLWEKVMPFQGGLNKSVIEGLKERRDTLNEALKALSASLGLDAFSADAADANKPLVPKVDLAKLKAELSATVADTKASVDKQKAQNDAFTTLTEDFYQRGLIDLNTYLMARRNAIEQTTAGEIKLLRAQVTAELNSRTSEMTPSDKIASETKVADLRNQISIRQKQGEEQLNALERKGRDDREAGTEAALRAEADLAQAKGRTGEAGIKALEAEYDKKIELAGKNNDPREKAALVAQKPLIIASARLGDASKNMDRGQQSLNIGLGQIDNLQAQGLLTEEEAVRKKIALYQEFVPVLEKLAEVQLEVAKTTGNPDDLLKAQQNADGVEALKDNLRSLSDSLAYVKNAARDAFQNGLADLLVSIGDQTTSLTDKFKALGKAILNAIAQAMAMRAATELTSMMFGAPHAEGGHILGPGTSTSDSIPAYLSNGEFVIKAAAVARYGPGLFDALNGLRVPRFAQGGLVGSHASEGFRSAPLIGEINITVDSQGKGSVSGDGSGLGMAQRMKQAVIAIILDESRPGGELARR